MPKATIGTAAATNSQGTSFFALTTLGIPTQGRVFWKIVAIAMSPSASAGPAATGGRDKNAAVVNSAASASVVPCGRDTYLRT